MDRMTLGDSDLRVSRIGLGTMTFGASCDERESHAMLDHFASVGGCLIDTANIYSRNRKEGTFHERGEAEQFIGSWLRKSGKRDDVVIATKVKADMGDGFAGLSARSIRHQVERSLERLGVDRIDLYQAHGFDREVPIEETIAAFDALVKEGKIRHFGCCNFTERQLERARSISEQNGFRHFISCQNSFNLILKARLGRLEDPFILPRATADRLGLSLMIYAPLANGFLAGKFRQDRESHSSRGESTLRAVQRNCFTPEAFQLLSYLDELAAKHRTSVGAVTLAWYRAHPAVGVTLIGASRADQLKELLDVAVSLTAEEYRTIDELSDPL